MKDDETPPEELSHHGVKGQKWGVRKAAETAGRATGRQAAQQNDRSKEYLAAVTKNVNKVITPQEAAANLAKNKEKFAQKFAPSDGPIDSGKGLSPKQKKILIGAGIGVAAVGASYLASKYAQKQFVEALKSDAGGFFKDIPHPAPGTHLSVKDYNTLTNASQARSWSGGGFLTKETFDRPGFELPVGHTFFRISTDSEKDFRIPPGTYALSSIEDFHRYVVGFSKEKGGLPLHKVQFESTAPVKVPHITDVLDTLKEVMEPHYKSLGLTPTSAEIVNEYTAMSGGSWSSERSQNLFKALKAKGFGAIVDEMDAGVIGEKPLVVFGDQFSGKRSQPFTKGTLDAAAANLTEIGWRK